MWVWRVVAGVGEDEAGAALQRGVGGSHGVATGGNVVHEIDLAVRKARQSVAFRWCCVGRGRGQVAAVAGALRFNRPGAADVPWQSERRGDGGRCGRPGWCWRGWCRCWRGWGQASKGVSMSAAISQAAVSKSRAGLRGSLMA